MTKLLKKDKWAIACICISALLVLTALWFFLKPTHRQILNCHFDAFVFDSQYGVKLSKNTHIFFYSDGSGFRTESGFIDSDAGRLLLDRDVQFVFGDDDADGTFTLKYTRVDKRTHDAAPDNIWGTGSTPGTSLYLTATEIGPQVYLFRERGKPMVVCASVPSN